MARINIDGASIVDPKFCLCPALHGSPREVLPFIAGERTGFICHPREVFYKAEADVATGDSDSRIV